MILITTARQLLAWDSQVNAETIVMVAETQKAYAMLASVLKCLIRSTKSSSCE